MFPALPGPLIRRIELFADGAEDALVGRGGEIDQMLTVLVAVEGDDEAIDPESHRPAQVLILGREVVFAEVRDGVEQLAVRGVEAAVGIQDLRGRLRVGSGDDQTVDEIVVDVE